MTTRGIDQDKTTNFGFSQVADGPNLDAFGNTRTLGTLSILVAGIGGTAQCYATINWHEVR